MDSIYSNKLIRHSSLPKLAECLCYEAKPGEAGPAAVRGTLLDAWFRKELREMWERTQPLPETLGRPRARLEELESGDLEAVLWAVEAVRELAAGAKILSEDEECKVRTPGMEHVGTADAIILQRKIVVDLKSGQVRNYREQVAAYALGLMEEHFANKWTCVLLFCDAREVVVHEFTYGEAWELVGGILQAAAHPARKPVLCDYCNWCANAETCSARVQAVEAMSELAAIVEPLTEDQRGWVLESLLEDRVATGRFLAQAKVFDAFREKVEERVRELLEADPEAVPGWRLRAGGTSEVVFADDLARLVEAGTITWDGVLGAMGTMSGKKFRELWTREMATGEMPAVIRSGAERKPSLVAAKPGKTLKGSNGMAVN
jgi:hypothetical protein